MNVFGRDNGPAVRVADGARARFDAQPGRPVRVLFVVDSLRMYGAELHVCGLALALARRGCEVTVACSEDGPLAAPLAEANVSVRPLLDRLVKRRFSPTYTRKLATLIRQEKVDLVHAHMYASAVATALATLGTEVPFVMTEHTEGSWRTSFTRWCNRRVYHRAERVIAVSSRIRRRLVEQDGVPPHRVSVILNALPWERLLDRSLPALPAESRNGPTVGVAARPVPEKGVKHFLEATSRISRSLPDASFLVAGDGPLRDELLVLAQRLGMGQRIEFLGFRPDLPKLLDLLDVLVVPSLSNEGSPLVILEAMAAGVPVVGTTVGGIPEQIRHDCEGLLVPPADSLALSEAVLRLLSDRQRARRLGEAGRRRLASHFSYESMLRQTEAVYRAALRRPISTALEENQHELQAASIRE